MTNPYHWPCEYNEHRDRKNNPYFNILLEGAEVIPAKDDYSEDSFPDTGFYREHGFHPQAWK